MTLDRLKNGSGYQEHEPVSVTHDSKKDKISYIFSDGSKLINHDNDWCCEQFDPQRSFLLSEREGLIYQPNSKGDLMNIKIYVACLAAYNNGKLHGEWIDCTLGEDHIHEGIKTILATSPEPNAEEWAIHDTEGFGSIYISENSNIEKLTEYAKFIDEHFDLGAELIAHFSGDIDDAKNAIED